MGNFGPYYAKFYNQNLDLLYNNAGVLSTSTGTSVFQVLKAQSTEYFKRIGNGTFWVPPYDLTQYPIIAVGHIAIVYQSDAIAGVNVPVCRPFLIRTVQIDVESGPTPMYEISGPTLEQEFAEWPVWEDVGTGEFGYSYLIGSSGRNETSVDFEDNAYQAYFNDGDEITVICQTAGNRSGIEVSVGDRLYRGTQSGIPGVVTTPDGWEIDVVPPFDIGVITGDLITTSDFRTPTTDDIAQITTEIRQFLEWDLDVQGWVSGDKGTQGGTSHAANGQTVLQLLNEAAAITGEWWRIQPSTADGPPNRTLKWMNDKTSGNSSSINLVMPDQADAITTYADTSKGIIESFTREYKDERISHLIATCGGSGDTSVSLSSASDAAPAGFTLSSNPQRGIAWLENDSVKTAFEADGVYAWRWAQVNFSGIRPAGPSADSKETAANQLLAAAANWLDARDTKFRFYRVTCVCHDASAVQVGKQIELYYSNDEFTIDATSGGDGPLYVIEMKIVGGADGVRRYDLLLGEDLFPREDGLQKLISSAGNVENAVSVMNAGSIGSGSGGAAGTSHNPVTVTSSTPAGALTLSGQALTFTDADIDGSDPGTLTAATTNVTTAGVHYHAITDTADGETNASTILSSSASGGLRLDRLGINTAEPASSILAIDGDLSFIGAQSISTTADDLGISPAGNLILTPAGEFVTLGAGAVDPTIKTDDWASGLLGTGWGLSHDGHLDIRSLYADEMHVAVFYADAYRARAGGDFFTPSGSILSADFTTPGAIDGTATMYIQDLPGVSAMPILAENDEVKMRYYDDTDGFAVAFVTGRVSSYVDQGDGTQAWTFTLKDGPTSVTLLEGAPLMDFGQSGDGFGVIDVLDAAGNPYLDFARWYDNTYTPGNIKHPIRLGDLGGTGAEIKGVMGLFIGDVAGKYLVFSERKAEMHGMGLSLYDHANNDGYLRFDYIRVAVDYDGGTDNMDPNADVATVGDFTTSTSYLQTSTGTTYYNLIDNATTPDSAWVGNVAGQSATLLLDLDSMTSSFSNTIKVTVSGYVISNAGDGNLRVLVDILDNLGERITTTGELANETTGAGVTTVELRPLKILTEADWDDAIINIGWVFTPSGLATEAIKLDPTVPSIAVGDPLPTMTTGEGFWVGNYSGYYRMRIGKAGGAGMGWNGLQMTFTDSSGAAAITLDSTGNAEFTGTIDMGTTGEVVANSTTFSEDGLIIDNQIAGITPGSPVSTSSAIKFGDDVDDPDVYMYWYGGGGADGVSLVMDSQDGGASSSSVLLQAGPDSTKGARIVTRKDEGTIADSYVEISINTYPDESLYTFTEDGLTLDQDDQDGVILGCQSSDVTGMTSQGMTDANGFLEILKASGASGGAIVRAGGESNNALWLVGSAATADTTESSAARAPIILSGREDNAALANDENVVVWQNYTTGLMILKGDGELHNTYSTAMTNNFDEYDDVGLIRTFARSIGDTIQGNWDKFVTYNADDLDRLGIMNKDGFVSQQKMTMLQIGALWQLHERIAALEGTHETK